MRPSVSRYVDAVLEAAALARRDEEEVREELAADLAEFEVVAGRVGATDEEVCAMIEGEFGKAEELGGAIARAKGRFRTYLKKETSHLPRNILVALGVALVLRWQVVSVYRVRSGSMEPILLSDSSVVVNKLAYRVGGPAVGDVIAYDEEGKVIVAEVESVAEGGGVVVVRKANPEASTSQGFPKTVPTDDLIGRVWLITR